jgi:hypothetical protein
VIGDRVNKSFGLARLQDIGRLRKDTRGPAVWLLLGGESAGGRFKARWIPCTDADSTPFGE